MTACCREIVEQLSDRRRLFDLFILVAVVEVEAYRARSATSDHYVCLSQVLYANDNDPNLITQILKCLSMLLTVALMVIIVKCAARHMCSRTPRTHARACARTHARTHACTHAHHNRTFAYACAFTRAIFIHMHLRICMHVHFHLHSHAYLHVYLHAHVHLHVHSHSHSHMCTCFCIGISICMHVHSHVLCINIVVYHITSVLYSIEVHRYCIGIAVCFVVSVLYCIGIVSCRIVSYRSALY